ncbi:MAG: patatin-like phospholipase family protein [Deltaproteobacteria bacterium]|nr:patatin-like phospholipase family protein [Deltaproteobacteria bacterium]
MSVKIGIALGGGGARGLAHVGVLKVLEGEGIPIHCITGASIGAVVGAMYAQNPNVDSIIERFKQSLDASFYDQLGLKHLRTNYAQEGSFLHQASRSIKRRIVINLAQNRNALLKEIRLEKVLSRLIDEGNVEDTKIPLAIVATSLNTGDDIVFKTGDITTAIAASSAIPGFLPPVCLNDDLLTDGGASCPVPVQFLREMEANVTIGIEICMREYPRMASPNVIEIISRAEMITSRNLAQRMAETADVAIFPDTKDIHWSEFSRFDELIEAGIESTTEKLPEIKKAIRRKTPWYKKIFV